jgi:hypothetical protein
MIALIYSYYISSINIWAMDTLSFVTIYSLPLRMESHQLIIHPRQNLSFLLTDHEKGRPSLLHMGLGGTRNVCLAAWGDQACWLEVLAR